MSENFEQLSIKLIEAKATIRPVSEDAVNTAQQQLGLDFDDAYRTYLLRFGVIICGSNEVHGLGVPDDYYLNVVCAYNELSQDSSYPLAAVPLLDEGDGHYYLYDTTAHDIVLWAMPNGGIVRRAQQKLSEFLLKYLFQK